MFYRRAELRFDTHGRMYDFFRSAQAQVPRLFPPWSVDVVFEQGEWMVLRRR